MAVGGGNGGHQEMACELIEHTLLKLSARIYGKYSARKSWPTSLANKLKSNYNSHFRVLKKCCYNKGYTLYF